MAKYLDALGLGVLWTRIKNKIEQQIVKEFSNYVAQFEDIKSLASTSADNAKNYYELTTQAINSLSPDVANTLTYAQLVAKHGRAITKIAQQLNATYNNDGLTTDDEYTPGYIFKQVTETEMEAILAAGTAEENVVYLVNE